MEQKKRLLLTIILTGLIFYRCDKKENEIPDFRDEYIGKYQVTENINCYGPCFSCSSEKDTVIIINYGLTDSTISVLGRDVYIDTTGWYSAYHYGLRLWNDSILSTFMNGGLGCGQYESYVGYKISDKP